MLDYSVVSFPKPWIKLKVIVLVTRIDGLLFTPARHLLGSLHKVKRSNSVLVTLFIKSMIEIKPSSIGGFGQPIYELGPITKLEPTI